MTAARALAPAKVNLGLFLGPVRSQDAKHELVTVMQSISLSDELVLRGHPAGAEDEVVTTGLALASGENLAARALRAFRERTGWDGPPQRLEIHKRIPVAAGLGGGSADAAATLRLARHASGLGEEQALLEIAAELGADVPAQLAPGRWLARGAGERLRQLPAPASALALVVLPLAAGLSTGAVYAEADRLGLARPAEELRGLARELGSGLARGEPLPAARELLHNDLQRAAVSLCPEIVAALADVRRTGAELALVSGSGPTVLGLFAAPGPGGDAAGRARAAARSLAGRDPAPLWADAVTAVHGRAQAIAAPGPVAR
jgi:4-diphosphocytidyl-2-C-methyl-D-erythritol kinase